MSSKFLFASLRTSLFTALGLSVAACGGSVAPTSELDKPDSGGAGDAGGDAGARTGLCDGAFEITARGGVPSGFWACPDGTVHRVKAVAADPTTNARACEGTESPRSCEGDEDCAERPHGHCISITHSDDFGESTQSCGCQYACASDADCHSDQACIPGKVIQDRPVAFCAPAACRTGTDCGSGECGLSAHFNGCYQETSLGCRDAEDACRANSDCGAGESCVYSQSGGWHCTSPSCDIGRPLLIDGRARTAAPVSRVDWAASELVPDVTGLDPALREQLAKHWLEIAAMEHASVGSFARFSLQLLALGAPPDLLADTQRAALDEVEHARMAYGVASAYAGRKLGPGPLDPAGIDLATSRRDVIRALVFEACVSETLGVAEALSIAETVVDETLATVHRRIAQDEQRHAELAWRTLAWLLEGACHEERMEAELAFAEAIEATARDPEVSRFSLPEHGLLDAKAIGLLRRRALAEVVEPCASALLGRSKTAA